MCKGEKTKQLIEVLSELQQLTLDDGLENWAKWMLVSKTRLENSDFSGIEYLLGAYGGMGSFNDVYIQSSKEKDERFHLLKTRAWELANYIKANHEIYT